MRAGTLFQSSKLHLRLWMQAIYLLNSSKTNLAALELKRHLGVNYKAAWRMKHKIMQAMVEREEPRKLKVLCKSTTLTWAANGRGVSAGEARRTSSHS